MLLRAAVRAGAGNTPAREPRPGGSRLWKLRKPHLSAEVHQLPSFLVSLPKAPLAQENNADADADDGTLAVPGPWSLW